MLDFSLRSCLAFSFQWFICIAMVVLQTASARNLVAMRARATFSVTSTSAVGITGKRHASSTNPGQFNIHVTWLSALLSYLAGYFDN